MDDDAPLSALQNAKIKSSAVDEKLPLAALLAAKPKADTNGKSTGGKGRGGKGKARPADAAKKKEEKVERQLAVRESSSSSDSSSGDDDDDSDDEPENKAAPKRKAATKSQRMAMLKNQRALADEEGDEEEKRDNMVKKRDKTPKQQVVADLLCRWWYVLPDWPPDDREYYKRKLAERKLRQVTIQEWEWVPEEDDRGFHKVYELSQFRGVFRNSSGDMIDLRPQETCPCFQNFMKKEMPELYDLLLKALENQIKELDKSKYNEDRLKKELETKLNIVRSKSTEAKYVTGSTPKRSRTG